MMKTPTTLPGLGIDIVEIDRIHKLALKNRSFLEAIDSIFKDVLSSYAKKLSGMLKEGKLVWIGRASSLDTAKNAFVQKFINGHIHLKKV